VICLSGVCVSPLWPSETGLCPPPAQPELRIPAGRAGTATGRITDARYIHLSLPWQETKAG
jgi:hypothetical protein